MDTPLWKANTMLAAFGLTKVPMIGYVRPKVVEASAERTVMRLPLGRRTRNHLGSMYFGALNVGADLAAGWAALSAIQAARSAGAPRIDFVFKSSSAEFLRRPDGHVHFTCTSGGAVRDLVDKAIATGERCELMVPVVATVPSRTGDEPVAQFELELSIKARP